MSYLKKAFGNNLKYVRKLRGLTQEKLAELVNIDQRQLARIEAGESFATAETIEKISANLDVSVKILFHIDNIDDDNMTLDAIGNYRENLQKLDKMIQKIAQSNNKTDFLLLAYKALTVKSARESLKAMLIGMDL